MKKTNKTYVALTAAAISTMYACSHAPKSLTANLFKEKWDYSHSSARKPASDSAEDESGADKVDYVEKKLTLDVYYNADIPKKTIVYRGNPKMKVLVSIQRKDGVMCSAGSDTGKTNRDAVEFVVDKAVDLTCEFEHRSETDKNSPEKESFEVFYRVSKVDLSWDEVNNNLHSKLETAKKSFEKDDFSTEAVEVVRELLPELSNTAQIPANSLKGHVIEVAKGDYLEFLEASGYAGASQKMRDKKPVSVRGIKDYSAAEQKAFAGVKSGLKVKTQPAYSLVCEHVEDVAEVRGAKKPARTVIFAAAESTHAALRPAKGTVSCFFNGSARNASTQKGEFTLKYLLFSKAEVIGKFDGLLKNEDTIKMNMNKARDKENANILREILELGENSVVSSNARNQSRYEALKAVLAKAEKEKEALKERIEDLESSDSERSEKEKARDLEKRSDEIVASRKILNQHFPMTTERKLMKVAYYFDLVPTPFQPVDNRENFVYTDYSIDNGTMIYQPQDSVNGNNDIGIHEAEGIQGSVLFSKSIYSTVEKKQRFTFCHNRLDSVRNALAELKKSRSLERNTIMNKLDRLAVKDYRECYRDIKDNPEGTRMFSLDRGAEYKFCWRVSGEAKTDEHGRTYYNQDNLLMKLTPDTISIDYRTPGGVISKSITKIIDSKDTPVHPFFNKVIQTNFKFKNKNSFPFCKKAKDWHSGFTVTSEDLLNTGY